MQLYDRVRGALKGFLDEIPVINASAIAAQLDVLEDTPGDAGGWPSAAYGVVVPPFPHFFVEATTVARGELVQRGVFCSGVDLEGQSPSLPRGFSTAVSVPSEARWVILFDGFLYMRAYPLATYAGTACVFIKADGTLVTDMAAPIPILVRQQAKNKPFEEAHMTILPAHGVANHCVYALKAVAALHRSCPVDHVTPSRQVSREVERKTGYRGTDYYVLKVKPGVPGFFEEVASRPDNEPRRGHTVRGHFRTYLPDRPMFGRVGAYGAVWVPAHERGETTIGQIKKDYEVSDK